MLYSSQHSNMFRGQMASGSLIYRMKRPDIQSSVPRKGFVWYSAGLNSEGSGYEFPQDPIKPQNSESLDLSVLEGKRVLVVDDEPVIRHMLKTFFTKAGATVFDAGDGSEALSMFLEGTLDLVVMDVVMPGLDGITAAIRMHEQKPKIPVILASGYTEEQKIPELLKNGVVNFYLRKPYSRKGILQAAIQAIQGEGTTLV